MIVLKIKYILAELFCFQLHTDLRVEFLASLLAKTV